MPKRFHTPPPPVNPESIRRRLLSWYRRQQRPLPWRRTRNPYRIWVSEIMLQQTRVPTVLPYYRRWLRTFPTVRALAAAPLQRVLRAWEGLGYYQRARNLHRAARLLRGRLPTTAEAWQRLPGVGPYTAAAIASIAYGQRVPVVDGNVARVLTRLYGIRTNIRTARTRSRLWQLADRLLPAKQAGDFNQALMELGALVCIPRSPRCSACPIRRCCVAHRCGVATQLPNRGSTANTKAVIQRVVFQRRNGKLLLRQRPSNGLLAGLWELPPANGAGRILLTLRHSVLRQRVTLQVCDAPPRDSSSRWIPLRRLSQLPMPAAHRRALRLLLAQNRSTLRS